MPPSLEVKARPSVAKLSPEPAYHETAKTPTTAVKLSQPVVGALLVQAPGGIVVCQRTGKGNMAVIQPERDGNSSSWHLGSTATKAELIRPLPTVAS